MKYNRLHVVLRSDLVNAEKISLRFFWPFIVGWPKVGFAFISLHDYMSVFMEILYRFLPDSCC